MRSTITRILPALAAALSLLSVSACAGSIGRNAGSSAGGEGFAYAAEQSAVDAITADLEPVTLKFQPSSASPTSIMAPGATLFKDLVEKRSNGKITVDIVWGQAIASYGEVHDALADGRVDVAYTLPGYEPDEFPVVDAIGTAMAGQSPSPFVGELITNAVGAELSWQLPEVLEEYSSKGLTPLTPFAASGGYYNVCTTPTTSAADWQGRQVRIASSAQRNQVSHLGGSPVSMPYPETYEALQRGTVDCTLGQLLPSAESGIFDVAPNINYSTEHSISRTAGAFVAGASFKELPLAYQQIVFDSNALAIAGGLYTNIHGNAEAVRLAKKAGGQVTPFDDDVQEAIGRTSQALLRKTISDGKLSQANIDEITRLTKENTAAIADLGYADRGTLEDFDAWFDPKLDLMPYAKSRYEDGLAMKHRPR